MSISFINNNVYSKKSWFVSKMSRYLFNYFLLKSYKLVFDSNSPPK